MQADKKPYAIEYDLTNCDKEPLHYIRYVQPHALMTACRPEDLSVVFISDNCEKFLGKTYQECIGMSLPDLLPEDLILQIKEGLNLGDFTDLNPILSPEFHAGQSYGFIVHINPEGLIILEAEPLESVMRNLDFQLKLGKSIEKIQKENRIPELLNTAAAEVRKLTGFDRVMVYRFDEEGHGSILAESANDNHEKFIGLHYPATDIPQQARALFIKNQVRFISDLYAEPALIYPTVNPATGLPLDQTYCATRGTSPIHTEYLRNMGVQASMSVAIMKNDRLWGLFACHHYESILPDWPVRNVVKFLGQIISGHILINSALTYKNNTLAAQIVKGKLLEQMISSWDVIQGLTMHKNRFIDLIPSDGGAIIVEDEVTTVGDTPTKEQILQITEVFEGQEEELVWHTHHLAQVMPAATDFADRTAGVLLLIISNKPKRQYILWFRKEKQYAVNWAGNPEKSVVKSEDGTRLSPRKSFDKWKEIVRNQSAVWKSDDVSTALALRSDIKEFFLKKYQELQATNADLTDAYEELNSFSYTVAHDLRAPLRSINGFAQILQEDYEDKLDEYGKDVINIILQSADKMNEYIDNILNISKLGRTEFRFQEIEIVNLIKECMREALAGEKSLGNDRNIKFRLEENLPAVITADYTMMKQLFNNIIGNAVKYTRKSDPALIEILYHAKDGKHHFTVRDNGIGFSKQYENKVFEIFSRLTSDKTFEGTGAGMTIAQKIAARHNGTLTCTGEPGKGASFFINLPFNPA